MNKKKDLDGEEWMLSLQQLQDVTKKKKRSNSNEKKT